MTTTTAQLPPNTTNKEAVVVTNTITTADVDIDAMLADILGDEVLEVTLETVGRRELVLRSGAKIIASGRGVESRAHAESALWARGIVVDSASWSLEATDRGVIYRANAM